MKEKQTVSEGQQRKWTTSVFLEGIDYHRKVYSPVYNYQRWQCSDDNIRHSYNTRSTDKTFIPFSGYTSVNAYLPRFIQQTKNREEK